MILNYQVPKLLATLLLTLRFILYYRFVNFISNIIIIICLSKNITANSHTFYSVGLFLVIKTTKNIFQDASRRKIYGS